MRRALSLWFPVAAVMAIIWNASALPSSPGPPMMADWLQHGLAYMTLALVSVRAFAGGRRDGVTPGALGAAVLLASLYGATDEWHQMYVPGRVSELRDLAADVAGAVVGTAAAGAWSIIGAGTRRNHGL